MVLMAGASDSDSDHHATAKTAPAPSPPAPASSSPSPAPAARTRLHDFSFPTLSWGTHRLLRCSKDGASASPPPHPQTPSPGKEKPQGQQGSPGATGASQPPRPWNLRTRRSATVAPLASRSEGAWKAAAGQAHQSLASPPAVPTKRGFSASLTKEEIAEDFAAIRGTRPPRRPKKRPRAVQRQLDMLYPGLSLADVNLESYKIEER
ncbi:formin-like protein 18 [Panicum miliaceum]|uniref:Formin-like protein 18 n=1 Tax=Panicum miliaceum TaxID=4540 RepID=A0A3L6T7A2_PANMI|nr:formin-like protein 18 [Panicum miliaceum]